MTVLTAGGPTDFAAPDCTELKCKEVAGTHSNDLNLGRIMDKCNLATNLAVEPGDIITAPEGLF